jgi:hypothetical protein
MTRSIPQRYMQPHQARKNPPTPFEDLLGDSIERAYASGVMALPDMVQYLNTYGPFAPNGLAWSEDMFRSEMKRLGE